MKYTNVDAVKIVTHCAKLFQQNLVGKNYALVLTERPSQRLYFMETLFHTHNYLHLTGLLLYGKGEGKELANNFYNMCIDSRLSANDLSFKDGNTQKKLEVLELLMDISKFAKMAGDYNFNPTNQRLYTEKINGNVRAAMGFVREGAFYVPNSALQGDSRQFIAGDFMRVLTIFMKELSSPLYEHTVYVADKDLRLLASKPMKEWTMSKLSPEESKRFFHSLKDKGVDIDL